MFSREYGMYVPSSEEGDGAAGILYFNPGACLLLCVFASVRFGFLLLGFPPFESCTSTPVRACMRACVLLCVRAYCFSVRACVLFGFLSLGFLSSAIDVDEPERSAHSP
jgi:hypothetical protein